MKLQKRLAILMESTLVKYFVNVRDIFRQITEKHTSKLRKVLLLKNIPFFRKKKLHYTKANKK